METIRQAAVARRILDNCAEHGVVETDAGTFLISCEFMTDPYVVARAAAVFRDEINRLSHGGT